MLTEIVLAANMTVASHCSSVAEFAGHTMQARQEGVPVYQIARVLDEGDASPLLHAIVEEAYRTPRLSPHRQPAAVLDYQDEIYLICVEALR